MLKTSLNRVLAAGFVLFAVAVIVLSIPSRHASHGWAEEETKKAETKKAGFPRYSVVETQGHNLLVTDNATNKLYFYTTDKDKPVGSPLKLRGSLDLKKVGSEEIVPVTHASEK